MKNGRGSLFRTAAKTILTCPGRMWAVHPVFGFSGLMQAVVLPAWQSPLPPSCFEVLYQLNSLTSSGTVATSYPTSIGCLGTPRAAPMRRMAGSRDASMATHLILSGPIALTRLGLSAGCWGRIRSPEYSPVASAPGTAGIRFCLAHVRLRSNWLLTVPLLAQTMRPPEVTHVQGTTVKSCSQPRLAWA